MTKRHVLMAILVAAFMSMAVASTASASFIYTRGNQTESDYVIAGTITLGEVNNITVSQFTSGGVLYYNFVENGGSGISSFDSRCQRATPNVVFCPANSEGQPWHVDAELHDGDDSITMNTTRPGRIEGGAGADVLKGGSADDTMLGSGGGDAAPDGNDVIDGRGGADYIAGAAGTDTVTYASRSTPVNVSLDGAANDGGFGEGDEVAADVESISGSQGADTLTGNAGVNRIDGNGGGDTVTGLGQNDVLDGGTESDVIDGGDGNDVMTGGAGGETLRGGPGNDSMDAGDDADTLFGGPGADDMAAGGGFDIVDYAGVSVPLAVTVADGVANDGAVGEGDNVRGAEEILGGEGNDRLSLAGTYPRGELIGRGGNDTLTGGNSNDRLEGDAGNDTLEGSYSADLMSGGPGVDTVDYRGHSYTDLGSGDVVGVSSTPDGVADDGNDQIDRSDDGTGGGDNVGADVENVLGSDGPDSLVGTGEANKLTGGGRNDVLHGEGGNDTLDGGTGPDVMDGGPGTDAVTYASRSAPLRVSIDDVAADGEVGEGDDVRTTVENVVGGTGADLLVGSALANTLTAGEGNDVLDGGAGQDTLDGRGGSDTIKYADRTARVAVILDGKRNDGADPDGNGSSGTAEEGDKDVQIENATGGAAGDSLRATARDTIPNVLKGLAGDDTLNTREGTATLDTLECGTGTADRFAKDPTDSQTGCEVALP